VHYLDLRASWDDPSGEEPAGTTPAELLQLVDLQVSLLNSVATGGPRIETVNLTYRRRRTTINAGLRRLGIDPPFPWDDLWGWHGKWKEVSGTYAGRRKYINDLVEPVRDQLERLIFGLAATDPGPAAPNWPDLEQRVSGLHNELQAAESIDDLQDIGRRAREVHIDLASLVYRDEMLPASETQQPKSGDAKTRLFFTATHLMPGSSHEEWRVLIRAAWDLPNKITHSSGINRVDAFAAVQATVLLVRCFEQAVMSAAENAMPARGANRR
jgi:hypothetical protein